MGIDPHAGRNGAGTPSTVSRADQTGSQALRRDIDTRLQDHAQARTVMEQLADRANELNPYRGHAVRATYRHEFSFTPMNMPASATREMVIAPELVWAEIDLSVRAVRDRHDLLNAVRTARHRQVRH